MSIINYKSQIPLIDFLHRQDVRITIFSRYPVCQYTCHGKAATGKKGFAGFVTYRDMHKVLMQLQIRKSYSANNSSASVASPFFW